ncbi:hydroxymethylbilane synthase [Candidatus Viadribacter manganicus]|uniref:Porphobilinogen deaminase n=1 Tax=Candidatus Viadribacter manganicus TaxID=1759059 RepID=A0A1B1AHY6_9PROT|nr:hydroxymethylbilane synthase [Candidatus Viadribacter manganicus]ANP46151.1 porphobilinogen deaminase [Candidatus Viadribacter manganicus]
MSAPLFRIGARGSKLSLAQTGQTRARLATTLGLAEDVFEIVPIVTSGDRIQDRRLIEAGGKGLFTKELDHALLERRIDFAVHSLKDLPTRLPDGIVLACVPEREDPRDAFVSLKAKSLADLPAGARVGTASLRRQAQVLFARRDLIVSTLRGNVDTRLAKLEAGEADATYLAFAGLKRMGLADRVASLVDPEEAPPAACQGAIAITGRTDDARVRDALARCENTNARIEIEAERAFLDALDGSCRTPIAALARVDGAKMSLIGETLRPDGALRWRRVETIAIGADAIGAAQALGAKLGLEIRDEAGDAIVLDA